MKFIIDEMPNNEYDCPFSEWQTYPSIIEKSGDYICKLTDENCNLYNGTKECRGLKIINE